MKKVLITSYNLGYGGIEKSLITLLKNFNYDKYDVTLVLEKKEGVFLDQVPNKVKILEYCISNNKNIFIRKFLNLLKQIKWKIKNYKKYDTSICYATYSIPCSFLTRSSSNNKILFVHNDYLNLFKKDINKLKSFFDKIKINSYNHIVFVSNESRINIEKYYPNLKEKFITINNLINSEEIIKLSSQKVKLDKNGNKVCLFLGRLDEEQKRISYILELAKKSKQDNLKVEFWLIGDGPDKDKYELEKEKYNLENIKFLGSMKNPYPYLKLSDYLLLTSRYEGFPVVYNESIILNKKILTTVDVTDDFISISNRFGYILKEKTIYDDFKKVILNDNLKIEKVNYKLLNENRMNQIERLLDND